MRSAPLAPGRARGLAVFDWLWLVAWAAASSVWCVTAATQLSATFDEPVYIARGLEGWRTGSHGSLLRLGTMPLPADLQTLPLYLYERWHGVRFEPDGDLARLLPWARAATLGFWWLLLTYGRLAGRALAGPWGGRLAVALLACEPSLLAHAGLATTDIPLAACVLALVYHFRAGREAGWLRRVGLPTLWFAASVLAKASGAAIGPLCLVVVEVERLWSDRGSVGPAVAAKALRASAGFGRHSRPYGVRPWPPPVAAQARSARLTGAEAGRHRMTVMPSLRDISGIVVGGLVLVVLYCGSDWRVEPSFVAWAHDLPAQTSLREPIVWVADHLRIFSNAGEALVRQIRHNIRGHGVFLLDQAYARALWYYFPVLLSIKLSEPVLLALLLVAVVHRRALANWALLLAGVLAVYSLTFRVQLGVRMVLPLVAIGAVGVAAALVDTVRTAAAGWQRRALAGLAGAAVVWNAGNALAVWPQGLAYVNRFWGGTADGYHLVSDSNYDWGQGVKELLRWQQSHGTAPLAVWYFGTDPLVQQLPLRLLPLHVMAITRPDDLIAAVGGHLLAVSTTLLYGTGIDSEAYRQSVAVLRARPPVARTTTFFIYDFRAG